tara:strand:- start:228 stop:392 length:165 start_codon:yes stop_codon:yes gene_type:complete
LRASTAARFASATAAASRRENTAGPTILTLTGCLAFTALSAGKCGTTAQAAVAA